MPVSDPPAASAPAAPVCRTCRLEIRHRPVSRRRQVFCCDGCVAGGPCTCSYDEEPVTERAPITGAPRTSWPMTREALDALRSEVERVDADVAGSSPVGAVAAADRRWRTLRDILAGAVIVDVPGLAAIGRAVVVRADDSPTERYRIVLPGDGDPRLGWVSADSPLGSAVLGRRIGESATVQAPAGAWSARIVDVE